MRSTQLIELPGFQLAGISVITTNQNMRAKKDIGELWNRFHSGDVAEKIKGRLSDDLYCLYSDYENEDRGYYTTLIGYKVATIDSLPAGISGKLIPALHYQVYVSEGDLSMSVIDTWIMIWNAGISRSYIADFDLYPEKPDADGERRVYTYVSM